MLSSTAMNGWAFGKSYLRLEDYYCFTATVMDEISKVQKKDALRPFNATPIESTWLIG